MYCSQQLSHVIKQGDNLYLLARFYQTTVPAILALNPNLDPYNLKIGSSIIICPGDNFNGNNRPVGNDDAKKIALLNDMRLAWSQHVYWTRMYLISLAHRLNDANATLNRLMQNPADIAKIYSAYYPQEVAEQIERLIREHLQIGGDLIVALRDNKTAEANNLSRKWYMQAERMSDAFSAINPYYNNQTVQNMFKTHLDLTSREVAMRLGGNYSEDIAAFNKIESEAMMMADYFAAGILKQFPQSF